MSEGNGQSAGGELFDLEQLSKALDGLCAEAHKTAKEKGWWDGPERSVGEQFANFHAELSEAWEEYRKYGMNPDRFIYDGEESESGVPKPEGIAVELADLLIRLADTCGVYGIPLGPALALKLAYNKLRPYRHGGEVA